MLKRLTTAGALGLLLTACAGGPPPEPPAPPPFNPAGTYDVTFLAEGMEIGGVMIIEGSPDEGYAGNIDTEMGGAPITEIAVDGQTVTFYVPDIDAVAEIVFDGDSFSGGMSGAMGDADLWGTKRTGI